MHIPEGEPRSNYCGDMPGAGRLQGVGIKVSAPGTD